MMDNNKVSDYQINKKLWKILLDEILEVKNALSEVAIYYISRCIEMK